MYKARASSYQRRYKVHQVDYEPQGHVESDFLSSAENLSYDECQDERRQLLTEKARAENELLASKNADDLRLTGAIGLRIAGICTRLALLKKRIKHLGQLRSVEINAKAYHVAVYEIVPPEMLERIHARSAELRKVYTEAERPTWTGHAMQEAAE